MMVTLTGADVDRATREGTARHTVATSNPQAREPYMIRHRPYDVANRIHIEAALCELAVAKAFDLPWTAERAGYPDRTKPDVGDDIEVKYSWENKDYLFMPIDKLMACKPTWRIVRCRRLTDRLIDLVGWIQADYLPGRSKIYVRNGQPFAYIIQHKDLWPMNAITNFYDTLN